MRVCVRVCVCVRVRVCVCVSVCLSLSLSLSLSLCVCLCLCVLQVVCVCGVRIRLWMDASCVGVRNARGAQGDVRGAGGWGGVTYVDMHDIMHIERFIFSFWMHI